ncbi:AAA family ATPase [Sorangium sp. So ce426]|uniref:AAA family ATPase n=1 Tax=unclassified Sorangium TaxID=2621164 RepID=UPI003F5C4F1A
MLRELSVQQFRGLRDFTMSGLGRVNLLVGANNCGKTTVLEALHILLRVGDPGPLRSVLYQRGEYVQAPRGIPDVQAMEVAHLFEGHEIDLGSAFRMTGRNDPEFLTLDVRIVEALPAQQLTLPVDPTEPEPQAGPSGAFAIALQWNRGDVLTFPLTRAGGLILDRWLPQRHRRSPENEARPVELVTTRALDAQATVSRLEEVVLTENEEVLLRALRSIEPGIERIAPLGSALRSRDGRGGIAVKLAGTKHRIPLGSMGDGMWRMLGIALSVVRAAGGVLLIDEIDTGLHYSVMGDMWRLVHDAAKRLDVQVFAATHSRDCAQSLAAIVEAGEAPRPEVTIQRIERGNPRAIAFTDDEIRIAAEIGAEVR